MALIKSEFINQFELKTIFFLFFDLQSPERSASSDPSSDLRPPPSAGPVLHHGLQLPTRKTGKEETGFIRKLLLDLKLVRSPKNDDRAARIDPDSIRKKSGREIERLHPDAKVPDSDRIRNFRPSSRVQHDRQPEPGSGYRRNKAKGERRNVTLIEIVELH